jgi:uncharacterized protein YrzB (UPF0473 family)
MSKENNEFKDNEKLDELVNQIEALTQDEAAAGEAALEENAEEAPAEAGAEEEAESEIEEDGFEGANIVSLYDEDGNEYSFELLDYVDYEDKLYAIMIPEELSDVEDDQVAVIMETYFEGDEPNFIFVEDEELAQKILDSYSERED